MGFTTATAIASIGTTALSTYMNYSAQREGSKQLKALADITEQEGAAQSDAMIDIAMKNASRATRNAQTQLASAQLDAARSNLVLTGSMEIRQQDLATRLMDEIKNESTAALNNANSYRAQSHLNAQQMRQEGKQMRYSANTALVTGFGSAIKALS